MKPPIVKKPLKERLLEMVSLMRRNAKNLKKSQDYANINLQSERDAAAHSMEFWARRLEEELALEDR